MSHCEMCNATLDGHPIGTSICGSCQQTTGVRPLPPSRRPPRPCERCNSFRFVRAVPREHAATGYDHVRREVSPMYATYAPGVRERFFGGQDIEAPDIHAGFGALEMYICSGCGYVEWYCMDPATIPIGPTYMTEAIDYQPPAPPFR